MTTDPMKLTCPICKAKPGEPCKDTNLKHELNPPHRSRK